MLPFEIAQEEKALHGIRIRYHEVSGGGQTGSLICPLGSVLACMGHSRGKKVPRLWPHTRSLTAFSFRFVFQLQGWDFLDSGDLLG